MGWRILSPHYPLVYSELPEFVTLECDTPPYRFVHYVQERTCRWDRKHGEYEWVCTVTCTACGYVLHDGEHESHWAYCPNCGAKVVG